MNQSHRAFLGPFGAMSPRLAASVSGVALSSSAIPGFLREYGFAILTNLLHSSRADMLRVFYSRDATVRGARPARSCGGRATQPSDFFREL